MHIQTNNPNSKRIVIEMTVNNVIHLNLAAKMLENGVERADVMVFLKKNHLQEVEVNEDGDLLYTLTLRKRNKNK